MDIDGMTLLGAIAGGFLGAAFGALVAFVFTGIAVFLGIVVHIGGNSTDFLNAVAFGPVFGPHISFAAGVAAAAYAGRKGWLSTGRDIVTPLASLGKPSVLLVGAAFGVFAYLFQRWLASIAWISSNTDSIALTVVVSAVIARIAFGKTGLVGQHAKGLSGWHKFVPDDTHFWISFQQNFCTAALLGLFIGGIAAWAAVSLLISFPDVGGVIYIGFAISAVSLLFLGAHVMVPVTHHMTLVGGVAAASFYAKLPQYPATCIVLGAVFGSLSALLGEAFSRFWHIRGDSHIDPCASAIWPMTTAVIVTCKFVG